MLLILIFQQKNNVYDDVINFEVCGFMKIQFLLQLKQFIVGH